MRELKINRARVIEDGIIKGIEYSVRAINKDGTVQHLFNGSLKDLTEYLSTVENDLIGEIADY